jgi:hypothetical protein
LGLAKEAEAEAEAEQQAEYMAVFLVPDISEEVA